MADEPRSDSRISQLLDGWARRNGLQFAWSSDHVITYTGARGAWHLSTKPRNQRDDWISVHPAADGLIELELVADAGHVEVSRLDFAALSERLEAALDWFQSWDDFWAHGPGQGH